MGSPGILHSGCNWNANKWLLSLCFWLFPYIAKHFYIGLILILGAKCGSIKLWFDVFWTHMFWHIFGVLEENSCFWEQGRWTEQSFFLLRVEGSWCRQPVKHPSLQGQLPASEGGCSIIHSQTFAFTLLTGFLEGRPHSPRVLSRGTWLLELHHPELLRGKQLVIKLPLSPRKAKTLISCF